MYYKFLIRKKNLISDGFEIITFEMINLYSDKSSNSSKYKKKEIFSTLFFEEFAICQ